MKFYSQSGQDRFLLENFFRGKRGGVFVDVGAYDGETYSNTLFFEKTMLVIGALGIVTVAWFTRGSPAERMRQVWRSYKVSLVANVALGLAYLILYVRVGLGFDPGQAATYPIGPTADVRQERRPVARR